MSEGYKCPLCGLPFQDYGSYLDHHNQEHFPRKMTIDEFFTTLHEHCDKEDE